MTLYIEITRSDVHKIGFRRRAKRKCHDGSTVVARFAAMTGIASIQREFMPGLRIDDSRSIPNSTIVDREIECRSRQKRL